MNGLDRAALDRLGAVVEAMRPFKRRRRDRDRRSIVGPIVNYCEVILDADPEERSIAAIATGLTPAEADALVTFDADTLRALLATVRAGMALREVLYKMPCSCGGADGCPYCESRDETLAAFDRATTGDTCSR